MKRTIYLLSGLFIVLLVSCNSFKKTKDGIFYKIISDGKGQKIHYGNFYELSYLQTYKDSHIDTVLANSADKIDEFGVLDSSRMQGDQLKIFSQLRLGDSLIIKIPTDSILKKNAAGAPPYLKRSEFIFINYKVVAVFDNMSGADSAYKLQLAAMKARDSVKAAIQLQKDDAAIADYLQKNNITATKGAQGTYVQIINPGTGNLIDTSNVVSIYYTGQPFPSGKAFDSNTDSNFHHTDPIQVFMKRTPEQGGMITGWTDGLKLLRKDAVARFYIPSSLAYGAHGQGAVVPNENLVFDIKVADVKTNAQVMAEEMAKRAAQMAMRQHFMDSMKVAKLKDSLLHKR